MLLKVSLLSGSVPRTSALALSPLNSIPYLGHQISFHFYTAKFSIFMSRLVLCPELPTYVFHCPLDPTSMYKVSVLSCWAPPYLNLLPTLHPHIQLSCLRPARHPDSSLAFMPAIHLVVFLPSTISYIFLRFVAIIVCRGLNLPELLQFPGKSLPLFKFSPFQLVLGA